LLQQERSTLTSDPVSLTDSCTSTVAAGSATGVPHDLIAAPWQRQKPVVILLPRNLLAR
jgi:hypothetical protein